MSGSRHGPPRARGAGVRARADVAGWWRDGGARAGENHDRRSRHSQKRDPHHVAAPGSRAFGDAREIKAFYRQLITRVEALPNVRSVSVSTGMPVFGPGFGQWFEIAGRPVGDPQRRPGTGINMVTPEFHATFGIRRMLQDARSTIAIAGQRAGRARQSGICQALPARCRSDRPAAAVCALRVGPHGRRTAAGRMGDCWRHADAVNGGIGREAQPEVTIPFWQVPWPQTIWPFTAAPRPPGSRLVSLASFASLEPELPLANAQTIQQSLSQSMADDRFYTVFFAAFAAVALVLRRSASTASCHLPAAQRAHRDRCTDGPGRAQGSSALADLA